MELHAKHPAILAELRRRIIAGDFVPGAQFPTNESLVKSYSASRVTIQKVIDRLSADGFVYAKGRSGTFVAENLPHLSHYALVFPTLPSDSHGWVRFWTALSNEAAALSDSRRKVLCFYGVENVADNPDFLSLRAKVHSQCLAGLIFAFPPKTTLLCDLLKQEIPCIAIASEGSSRVPAVDLNRKAFVEKALDHLKAEGRKRIALITIANMFESFLVDFNNGLSSRRMQTRPYWTQFMSLRAPSTAKNCAHLLLNPEQKTRPDGLIISDDNFVEYATQGLIAAGVQVPEELSVVAHCNFPWPTPSVVPVARLGYDAREVLQACIEKIDRQRHSHSVPRKSIIEPVFENEIKQAASVIND